MLLKWSNYHSLSLPLYVSVHPCDQPSNGGCEKNCTKNGDDVKCSCGEDEGLNEDGKSCSLCTFIYLVLIYTYLHYGYLPMQKISSHFLMTI